MNARERNVLEISRENRNSTPSDFIQNERKSHSQRKQGVPQPGEAGARPPPRNTVPHSQMQKTPGVFKNHSPSFKFSHALEPDFPFKMFLFAHEENRELRPASCLSPPLGAQENGGRRERGAN